MIIEIENVKDMHYEHARVVDGIKTRAEADAYAKAFTDEVKLYWLKPAGLVFRPDGLGLVIIERSINKEQ